MILVELSNAIFRETERNAIFRETELWLLLSLALQSFSGCSLK